MSTLIGYHEISDLIHTTPPLLMVDRLEVADDGNSGRGMKAASMDEEFFQGHFPGAPIMPGVLQVAGMLQVAEALLRRRAGTAAGLFAWLKSLRRVKFRNPVFPGDRLVFEVELGETEQSGGCNVKGKAMVNGKVTCQGNFVLDLVDPASLLSSTQESIPDSSDVPEVDQELAFDTSALMDIIPHRYPFFLIDRVLRLDAEGGSALALKNVTGNEPFFRAVTFPFMPAYLQVEAAAQAGCAVALKVPGNEDKLGYFMSIDEAVFLKPICPGDQVLIDLAMIGRGGRFGVGKATLSVDGSPVSQATVKFAIVDRS